MKTSFFIALVIAVVAIMWVMSGVVGNSRTDNPKNTSEESATISSAQEVPEVRVKTMSAELMKDVVDVTGRTKASRRVALKAETDGRVISIKAEKGTLVKKGTILARLELEDRSARVLEAEQLLNQRQIQYNAARELSEKGFNSRIRLAESLAELESAKAQLKNAKVELSNINIRAPFDGVINNQMVEVGDYVSTGDDMFDIVDLDPIEITGFLTEKQVEFVSEGTVTEAEFLKGNIVTGKVSFIASAANAETRTFEIEVTTDNPDHYIKEGLTAKIKIPVKETNAYKISPSILSLSDDGTVGVKIVNENDEVEFKPIRLLKDTPDYLWIGGLPDTVKMITVGQEFVTSGQKVKPVSTDEGQSLL